MWDLSTCTDRQEDQRVFLFVWLPCLPACLFAFWSIYLHFLIFQPYRQPVSSAKWGLPFLTACLFEASTDFKQYNKGVLFLLTSQHFYTLQWMKVSVPFVKCLTSSTPCPSPSTELAPTHGANATLQILEQGVNLHILRPTFSLSGGRKSSWSYAQKGYGDKCSAGYLYLVLGNKSQEV